MLITSLLPMLARYSLGLDLVAGPDDTVTLTIVPRKGEGAKAALDAGEARPISITATAAEIDAELARGEEGALGQIFAARKTLADQLAEHRAATETAKSASAKAKPTTKPAGAKLEPTIAAAAVATAAPGEPVSLF
ncbi:PRTRC system protein E [Sphingomonas sp. ABOLE]|uniref:PRTRC system protein E n=1 Tax=Sphingomonas sp. ABOLE TaxID=1985878 RepID=UPI000F7DB313|nr:PRTRC system protein E [Sphingomonas sp. ABOLE]RSV44387.1 PRTRC system protein E [Sphingomonas sp. ABOLE]